MLNVVSFVWPKSAIKSVGDFMLQVSGHRMSHTPHCCFYVLLEEDKVQRGKKDNWGGGGGGGARLTED